MGANHNDQKLFVSYQFELAMCNLINALKSQNHYKARKQGQGAYPGKKPAPPPRLIVRRRGRENARAKGLKGLTTERKKAVKG